jgi:LmbE family N-acetylglucosaminyl deacetylase
MLHLPFHRPLIFVAHPDDESIACGGLLQRVTGSLVVFATDGTPAGYGLENTFGSLQAYTDLRIQEGSRAVAHIPSSSSKWITKRDRSLIGDQHVFEDLPEAALSLRALARSFSPDAIVSHCYEGAHIDHDSCSFLAMHVAAALSLPRFEFPMYWLDAQKKPILQKFRDVNPGVAAGGVENAGADVIGWQLTEAELACKKKMMLEYDTQRGTVATFSPTCERFRPAVTTSKSFSIPLCRSYLFQEKRRRFYHTDSHRLSAKALMKKFAEFETWCRQNEDWRK